MEFGTIPNHWRYLGIELKRGYQANFLWSMAIVYGVLLTSTACIMFLLKTAEDVDDANTDIVIVTELLETRDQESGKAEASDYGNSRNAKALLSDQIPRGFMHKLKIIRDDLSPALSAVTLHSDNPHEPIDDIVKPDEFEQSPDAAGVGGAIALGESDDGLPTTEPFLPPAQFERSNSPPINLKHSEKGLIMLAAIQWPTIASLSDTGYVEIILNIDKKGRIEWLVQKEQPTGKGFASALTDALIRSKFNPPTNQDGEKVPIQITLSSIICYNCPLLVESHVGNVETIELSRGR